MTVLVEGEDRFILSAAAQIIEDDREVASKWASQHVQHNPALKWILGKYVEADRANSNKQFWTLDSLQMARPTVAHAPLNILHRPKHIVGAFVATEMIYPTGGGDGEHAATEDRPYIEALATYWRYYFPDELQIVEAAHNAGSLFFSMECVSDSITCAGEFGCGTEFAYAGPRSDNYCEHLQKGMSIKQLNKPHFLAGALIVPPERPGWKGANIKEISELMKANDAQVEAIYNAMKAEAPHLDPAQWEQMMVQLLQQAGKGWVPFKKKGAKDPEMDPKKKKKTPAQVAAEVLRQKK